MENLKKNSILSNIQSHQKLTESSKKYKPCKHNSKDKKWNNFNKEIKKLLRAND